MWENENKAWFQWQVIRWDLGGSGFSVLVFHKKVWCSKFMAAPVNNNTRKQICSNKIFFFDTKDSYKLEMNSNKDG